MHYFVWMCAHALVWQSHSSSPLHGFRPADVSLHGHVTSAASGEFHCQLLFFFSRTEALKVKHTLPLCLSLWGPKLL